MAVNARQYREEMYRLRAHPRPERSEDFVDERDSVARLYVSMIPFLFLEYFVELQFQSLISGLVFPTGFLLFWAFYYSFYQPGVLEENLTRPKRVSLAFIPAMVLGVAIWFVKVTVVEVSRILVLRWFMRPAPSKRAQSGAYSQAQSQTGARAQQQYQYQQQQQFRQGAASSANTNYQYRQQARPQTPPPRPARPTQPALPRDVMVALATLGLGECRDWKEIHHRYRELAKQYHPDLNPEITQVGRRFMAVDQAYKKLSSVKAQYFPEKRSTA